jgi:hypothetical protein
MALSARTTTRQGSPTRQRLCYGVERLVTFDDTWGVDMTGDAAASNDGSGSALNALPPNVAQAAQQRGLGVSISTRALPSPVAVGIMCLAAAAVFLGLLVLTSQIGQDTGGVLYSLLRFVALFSCFGMVGALAYGVAALVRGAQAYYVYSGGVVHRRNSNVRAFTWAEVTELRGIIGTKGDRAGKLMHYKLTPAGAKPFLIPINIVDGKDEFLDHLIAGLKQHGRPVI